MEQGRFDVDIPIRGICNNSNCEAYNSVRTFISPYTIGPSFGLSVIKEKPLGLCEACGEVATTIGETIKYKNGILQEALNLDELHQLWGIMFMSYHQVSQLYGTDNEHMIGRVTFGATRRDDLENQLARHFECNVRQTAGESFSYDTDPIEVDLPEELRGQINYAEFRDAVEEYIRMLVRGGVLGINTNGPGHHIQSHDNFASIQHWAQVRATDRTGNAW